MRRMTKQEARRGRTKQRRRYKNRRTKEKKKLNATYVRGQQSYSYNYDCSSYGLLQKTASSNRHTGSYAKLGLSIRRLFCCRRKQLRDSFVGEEGWAWPSQNAASATGENCMNNSPGLFFVQEGKRGGERIEQRGTEGVWLKCP